MAQQSAESGICGLYVWRPDSRSIEPIRVQILVAFISIYAHVCGRAEEYLTSDCHSVFFICAFPSFIC